MHVQKKYLSFASSIKFNSLVLILLPPLIYWKSLYFQFDEPEINLNLMNKKSQEKKIIYCILLRLTHRRRAVSQAIEILLEIYILFSCCFEEMAGNTSTVREVTFKKWAFASDFYFKAEGGIIISARCKFCSEVDYNKLFCEAKRSGLKGQVMKSLLSYRDNITYIHRKTLSRHVGDANSMVCAQMLP